LSSSDPPQFTNNAEVIVSNAMAIMLFNFFIFFFFKLGANILFLVVFANV
jgi:hypothetical protein